MGVRCLLVPDCCGGVRRESRLDCSGSGRAVASDPTDVEFSGSTTSKTMRKRLVVVEERGKEVEGRRGIISSGTEWPYCLHPVVIPSHHPRPPTFPQRPSPSPPSQDACATRRGSKALSLQSLQLGAFLPPILDACFQSVLCASRYRCHTFIFARRPGTSLGLCCNLGHRARHRHNAYSMTVRRLQILGRISYNYSQLTLK